MHTRAALTASRSWHHREGQYHPTRLTQQVRQQIKCLTLWRSTFYAEDFPLQRPMSSVKELHRLYLVFCNLCNPVLTHGELATRQQGIGLRANAGLTPYLKLGGCASGPLIATGRIPRQAPEGSPFYVKPWRGMLAYG